MSKGIKPHMLTPAERRRVREMALAGASTRAIAKALDRGADTIKGWRAKLGVPEADGTRSCRAWTARDLAELTRAWLACERQADIAAALGRTEWAVTLMARIQRLPKRRRVFVDGAQRIVLTGADGSAEPPPKTKKRKCLNCPRHFPSEGAHNRLCGRCRGGIAAGWIGQEPDPYNVVPVRRRAA